MDKQSKYLRNTNRIKRTKDTYANYTIGYQKYQVDELLNTLLKHGIEQLIDTRSNPISRRYGFHKSTLSKLCKNLNIEYTHVPEFGIPSQWRQELETEEAYQALFKRYQSEVLDKQTLLLKQLAEDISKKPSALLCREAEPHQCHRSHLAKRLATINTLPIIELK